MKWIRVLKLWDLDFADDIAQLTDSKENMRKIAAKFSRLAAALGLQFNVQKTKLMEVGKNITWEGISIISGDIEIVEDFCRISDDSNWDKEIRSRLAKADFIFGCLRKKMGEQGFFKRQQV